MTRPPAGHPLGAAARERGAGRTDDEVHAAWRRPASATHPDREDGGDPERFAEAAAAYTALRTRFGRGEVLADLGAGRAVAMPSGWRRVMARLLGSRVWRGRPARLGLRVLVAAAACAAAVAPGGPHPAAPP